MEWAILLGFAFAELAWIGTLLRIAMRKRLDLVDWFVGTMAAFNGIGYAFIVWASNSGLNQVWDSWIVPYSNYYWLPPILSLIAVSNVWLGAALTGVSRNPFRNQADLTPKASAGINRLAWGFLFAGIFCYYLYARAYGGFFSLLSYSSLIRSGMFDVIGIDNPLSFMGSLGGLAFFSSFLFYALMIEGHLKGYGRLICSIGFASSLCFSLYVFYSWMSRVSLVMYLCVFPLAYVYHRSRYSYRIIIKLPLLVLAIAIGLPVLSLWMTPGKASASVVEFYARELSFPSVSLFSAIENDHFRFFFDLLVTPLYMLPERIWSGVLGLTTSSNINTEIILGYPKGEGGVTGQMPTDMITFGYMQLGVAGVAIWGILVGAGLAWLERLISWMPGRGLQSVYYAYCVLMISTLTVLYADPQLIIYRNITIIIATTVLFVFLSWKRFGRES